MKIDITFVIAALLVLLSAAQTPQNVMFFNASLSTSPNSYIRENSLDYMWQEVYSSQNQTILRQTFLNFSDTGNLSQFQLILPANSIVKAFSTNLSCLLVYSSIDGSYSTYLFDNYLLSATQFINITNIPELLQTGNMPGTTFNINNMCWHLQINNTVYQWGLGILQYTFLANNSIATDKMVFDQDQFRFLMIGNKMYFINSGAQQFIFVRNQSHFKDVQIISSYYPQQRFIVFSTQHNQTSGKFAYKISVNKMEIQFFSPNQFGIYQQQLYFRTIYQTQGYTSIQPLQLFYDSNLQRIGFTGLDANNKQMIKAVYINYNEKKFYNMNIPTIMLNFQHLPYLSLSENFAYVRQQLNLNSPQRPILQQVYQFLGTHWMLVNQRNVSIEQNRNWQSIRLYQDETSVKILHESIFDDSLYYINQTIINKTVSHQNIQNQTDPNVFLFSFPITNNQIYVKRTSTTPKWIVYSYDTTSSPISIMTEVFFDNEQPDNKKIITNNQNGNWTIIGISKQNLSCLAAYNSDMSNTKLFYYNQSSNAVEEIADITQVLTLEGISNPLIADIQVSNNCSLFSIEDKVYGSNTTNYNNVTVPDGWNNVAFDQTFKIAVFDGNIYQYNFQNNSYYSIFNPEKPVMQNKEVYLNIDKLIILSYQMNNSVNPPITQYRVHCLWFNGANWDPIDVAIEGVQTNDKPKIKISPDFQTIGLEGIDQTNNFYVKARLVNYRTKTSKNILIPSFILKRNNDDQYQYIQISNNFFYFRIMSTANSSNPLIQNYEVCYQLNKINAFLIGLSQRNFTQNEQLSWRNTYISEVNSLMIIFYQYQSSNSISLVRKEIGSLQNNGYSIGALSVNGQIYNCPIGCWTCLTVTKCDSCFFGYTLDSTTFNCKKCGTSCKQCMPAQLETCTACYPGSYLRDYYYQCLLCDKNCSQCKNSEKNCISCIVGFFVAADYTCHKCPLQNCIACSDVSTCTVCKPGFSLTSSNQCVQCPSICSICDPNNIFICLACTTGYELINGQCVKCSQNCNYCLNQTCNLCKNGYRTNSNGKCIRLCTYPCINCLQSNPQSCLSCFGQYILSGYKCIPNSECNKTSSCGKCALGFVLFNGVCYPCQTDSSCQQCDSSDLTVCASCNIGYFLSTNSKCTLCPAGCLSCYSDFACSSCFDGFTLSGSSLISQCIACQFPCVTCSQSPSNCLSCANLYKLQGWKCRSKINVQFQISLNLNYNIITTSIIQAIIRDLISIINQNSDNLTLTGYYQGSTVIIGAIDKSDSAQVTSALSALSIVNAGSSLGGQPVISSSFTGNYNADSSSQTKTNNMLIIILAVVGSAIVVILVFSILFWYRCRNNQLLRIQNNEMTPNIVDQKYMKQIKTKKDIELNHRNFSQQALEED